jgi:hypothetical protein
MTRLLIQCQGSPTLSFKVTQAKMDAVLHHYYNHHRPQNCIVPLTSNDGSDYHINLATVSWICVTEETN